MSKNPEKAGPENDIRELDKTLEYAQDLVDDDPDSTQRLQGAKTESNRDTAAVDDAFPVVPGYSISGEIARGGMGCVFAGRELALDREVAIKVLRPTTAPSAAARFVTESKVTARLPHPGIPPVYALGELVGGGPFLAMKLVRGRTLEELLKQRETLDGDLPRWTAVFEDVCQAVGFAHSQHVLHRDLKPANVMVGAFGEVHVMDWGLAKEVARSSSATEAVAASSSDSQGEHRQATETLDGTVMGTPTYMAPEQARGEVVDARADVFALGGVLCRILTGEPAFTGQSSVELVRKAASGDTSHALHRLAECGADGELVDLATQCLSVEPTGRPANAQALAELVAAYRSGVEDRLRQALADKAATEVRVGEQRKRRRLGLVAVGAVLGVLLIGVIGTTLGMIQANKALGELTIEQDKTANALREVTAEQTRTKEALEQLSASRERNVEHLNEITESLVLERMSRQQSLSEADRAFIEGLLPMWMEISTARGETAEGRAVQAAGHHRVAELQVQLGQRAEAEQNIRTALSIRRSLADENPANPQYQQDVARTHNSLAIMLRDTGKIAEAETNYRAALERIEKLTIEYPDNAGYLQDFAGWQNNLGRLLARLGQLPKAVEHLRKSLAYRQQLADDFPRESKYRRDLAESHNNLAIMYAQLGDLPGAEKSFRQALSIRQGLVSDFPKVAEHRLLLANTYSNLGTLFSMLDNPVAAEENFREAVVHKQRLAADYPAIPKYRQEVANSLSGLASTLDGIGKPAEAKEAYAEAIELSQGLVSDFPDVPDYRRELALMYGNRGSTHLNRGELAEAEELLLEALAMKRALIEDFPEDAFYRQDIVNTLYGLACVYAMRAAEANAGDRPYGDEAMSMLRQAVEAGWSDGKKVATDPNLKSLYDRAEFQQLLSDLESRAPLSP